MTVDEAIKRLESFQRLRNSRISVNLPINFVDEIVELLKKQQTKKSKGEVLLAIIGKQSYTDLEKFKQLEELNDEYFNGMLDSIRAVEKLFDDH